MFQDFAAGMVISLSVDITNATLITKGLINQSPGLFNPQRYRFILSHNFGPSAIS